MDNKQIVIADIGAAGGVHPRWDRLSRHAFFLLFEPDAAECQKLRAGYTDQHAYVSETALGASAGERNIHLTRKPANTSFFRPNTDICNRFFNASRFDIVGTETVDVSSSDALMNNLPVDRIDFLKIDAQGAELEILKGADAALEGAIGIECEVEFLPMYADQPLFADVDTYIREKGFELYALKRSYLQRDGDAEFFGNGQIFSGDALYFRPPEVVATRVKKEPSLAGRAVRLYLAYGLADQAARLVKLINGTTPIEQDLIHEINTWRRQDISFPGHAMVQRLAKRISDMARRVSDRLTAHRKKRRGVSGDTGLGNNR